MTKKKEILQILKDLFPLIIITTEGHKIIINIILKSNLLRIYGMSHCIKIYKFRDFIMTIGAVAFRGVLKLKK